MSWRILLGLLLVVPAALAHGEAAGDRILPHGQFLNHLQPVETELRPGEVHNWTLAFGGAAGGGVMHDGWYWLVRGDVEGSTPCSAGYEACGIRARLLIDGQFLESWLWQEGPQMEIARVPGDGFLELRLENVGSDNATVSFYYDQTCDCVGKVVPGVDGPVWFNTDARAGDEVRFNFTVEPVPLQAGDQPRPESITLRARHLVPDEFGGFVPKQDVTRNWNVDQDASCSPGRWTACFELAVVAPEDGMQLVLVETRHDGGGSWGTGVRPVVESEAGKDASLALWLLPLALAIAYRRR